MEIKDTILVSIQKLALGIVPSDLELDNSAIRRVGSMGSGGGGLQIWLGELWVNYQRWTTLTLITSRKGGLVENIRIF